jgi:hypothetical protein
MNDGETVELKVHMRYRQGYSGILVGQSIEFPFIIVQGKNVEELVHELTYETQVYFNTFPEEGEKALQKFGKIIVEEAAVVTAGGQLQRKEEKDWDQKSIPITIPIERKR